ncbi:phosphohistidine phosphatase SixA [bacterium]|nr:phosphohistidine phosphatase SixA [bacterium]
MIKIYMLRHEEAVPRNARGLDRDRALTPEGEKKIAASARGMARLGITPDRIWTSPYVRAVQTARAAAADLGMADKIEEKKELSPGADPGEIADLIAKQIGEEGSVMIVGHNPDFEQLIAWLISPRGDANIDFKKGALALIHAGLPIKQGSASLRWLMIPSQMAQADQ